MAHVPASGAGERSGRRVLLVSIRKLNSHAAWCSNYEFEDVIAGVDDVDVLELEPGGFRPQRQRLARSLAFRRLGSGLNPGVANVEVERDYDLMIFVCMNVWDLLYLNALRGWRERCRVKVCYMVEFYTGQETELAGLFGLLEGFDHVTQSFATSAVTVAQASGRPCSHVPLAVDALRFTPFPAPPARVIDVLSIGRRSEPAHRALRADAREHGIFYLHDTIAGAHVHPTNPAEHRENYASQARRARLFVTYPAKFAADENRGLSEVGARYYEGLAAGAVLLGNAPTSPGFREDFPWDDAVAELKADGSDAAATVTGLLARPEELARLSRRNALHALRNHDWAHRWKAILALAGLPAPPALEARLARLDALARGAEAKEEAA